MPTSQMKAVDPTLRISQTTKPTPASDEVLVRVWYFTLSIDDVLAFKMGVPSSQLGANFTGIVAEGPAEGTHVMGFLTTGGAMAEFVACHKDLLLPIPGTLTLKESSIILEPWITAYQLLKFDTSFVKRDRVAVFGAASPVGLAVVQLAQILGCRRVHAVDSQLEYSKYKMHGALPDEVVISETALSARNISLYDPKGVQVMIDLRCRPQFDFEMVRPLGRAAFAHTDIRTAVKRPLPLDLMLVKNIRLQALSMRSQKPANFVPHLAFIQEHIMPKILSGRIPRPESKVFDWKEVHNVLNCGSMKPFVHIFAVN